MSGALEVLAKICQKSIFWRWPWSNCCFQAKCSKVKGNIKIISITRLVHGHCRPHSLWLCYLYYLWPFPEIPFLFDFLLPVTLPLPLQFLIWGLLSWHLRSLSYLPLVIPSFSFSWEKENKNKNKNFFAWVYCYWKQPLHFMLCFGFGVLVLGFFFFSPHILLANPKPILFTLLYLKTFFLFLSFLLSSSQAFRKMP